MDPPLISILVASRNPGSAIRGLVKSINEQCCADFEVLVADAASSDGTADLLSGGTIANLGWWRSEPDQGIYDALNAAAASAKGEWLLVLGADDSLHEATTIEKLSACLQDTDTSVGLVYGDLAIRSGGVRRRLVSPPYQSFIKSFGACPPIHHQCALVRRHSFQAAGGFNTAFSMHADYYLMSRISMFAAVEKIDCVVAEFSDSGATSGIRTLFRSIRELRSIRSELGHPGFTMAWWKLFARSLAKRLLQASLSDRLYSRFYETVFQRGVIR